MWAGVRLDGTWAQRRGAPVPRWRCKGRSKAAVGREGWQSVKPSAQPTLVRTQHLPRYFRRSKPVSPDGDIGFCVPWERFADRLWASCGPGRMAGYRSNIWL